MRFLKKNKKQNVNWLLLQVATCHLICGLRFVTLRLNIRPPELCTNIESYKEYL